VMSRLRNNPGLDVNWADDEHQMSVLHIASYNHHTAVVKLLLAHPHINVNQQDTYGRTPFSLACAGGHVSVIQLLLNDPRVDVTLSNNYEPTPLWHACYHGKLEIVESLIASCKDLGDFDTKKWQWWDGGDYNAIEVAGINDKGEIVSLLERFMANPTQTRHDVRVKLGVLDELAAEVFALTIFL